MSRIPTTLDGVDGPMSLIGRRVQQSLDCLSCGYDLQGSPADGRCPECGLPVPYSLAGTIDPAAHRLPPLANAPAVARGLVLAASALTLAASSTFLLSIRDPATLVGRPPSGWLAWPWWPLAIGVAALSIWGAWNLRFGNGMDEARRSSRASSVFLLGALLCVAAMAAAGSGFPDASSQVAAILAAVLPLPGLAIGLIGFRGVLLTLGRRSRQFRDGAVRRQRIPSLLAAIAVVAAAWIGLLLLRQLGNRDTTYGVIPVAIGLTAMLFVTVGHWYLLVNACWIRSALRRPPLKLAALLGIDTAANLADQVERPQEPVSGDSAPED